MGLSRKKKSDAIGNQISDEKDTFRMQLKKRDSDDETSEFKEERNKIWIIDISNGRIIDRKLF